MGVYLAQGVSEEAPLGGDAGAALSVMSTEEAAGVPGRSGHKGLEVRVGVSRKGAGGVGRHQVVEGLEPA